MIICNVEIDGEPGLDVRLAGGEIVQIGRGLRGPHEFDGRGGALIPGLCDHHIHLFALAAQADSLSLDGASPQEAASRLTLALAARPPVSWLRVTGYDESMWGDLDRTLLDRLAPQHPVRVQHRTGSLWIFNSAALELLGEGGPSGFDRSTGRLFRADAWLRERVPAAPPPLAPVGRLLAAYGITAVTDASVTTDAASAALLAEAARSRALPQRLTLMSGGALPAAPEGEYAVGPVKILLDDHRLPDPEEMTACILGARAQGRSAAVHCVTAGELALTLAAFEAAGAGPGDRVEHGSVIPGAAIAELKRLGLTVVTQPIFVAERGDRYLDEVEPGEHVDLYRCRSLRMAGVPVALSSDAPYGSPDPWRALAAAVDRRTRAGRSLASQERVTPSQALNMYMGSPSNPAGPPRRIAPGAAADVCLLNGPLREALSARSADVVANVFIAGELTG